MRLRRRRALVVIIAALVALPGSAVALARNFEAPASSDPYQQYTAGSVQRQDTPNDPNYDNAEPDTQNALTATDLYDERFDLFGFPSTYTMTSARYHDPFDAGELHPDGSTSGSRLGQPQVSGYNAAGAWKLERGRPDALVAILDTGIKWDKTGLRRQVHLNRGELPYPMVGGPALESGINCASYKGGVYDASGDGVFNVEDYACDPRVSVSWSGRTGPKALVTGQDLIHAFGNCQLASDHTVVGCPAGGHFDNDHNGYANDIAGWNFFDNTNDPTDRSSYFAAANHGSGRAEDAVEQGNDGEGSIGTCPHCQFTPIRVWDTFVSDANTFGLAVTYATDNGVKVIEGADGNLYHSAFSEAASQYAYDHGVVQTYSGDDLNTANHNYPGNYGHAMLIQGTVPDADGLGTSYPSPPSGTPQQLVDTYNSLQSIFVQNGFGSQVPTATYFRGANTTQFGGHSSISMEGATGSINTGRASGAAALVVGAGLDHGITLLPDETREILEQTAERVTNANTAGTGSPDLAAPQTCPAGTPANSTCATPDEQWTSHFGWGRADLGAAVALAASGKIPPQAAIDAPDWFAPLPGGKFEVTGTAAARFAAGKKFTWKLMWAPGLQPAAGSWQDVPGGHGTSTTVVHDFGSINLDAVRTALASVTAQADPGSPVYAPGSDPLSDQFTVQLEVSGAGIATTGIDRRVFTAIADPTLRPGYPKRLGTGGEAPIRYADINGDNVPELVTPTEDGLVHAYEPDGSELSGWPVHTQEQSAATGHESSPALRAIGAPSEPPRAPVIADLLDVGRPDVITAAGTHVYAWSGDGKPLAGFPVSMDLSHCGPALESQALGERPKCGFLASPTVAHLQGYRQPADIVVPGLDGWLYAFRRDGRSVPNFPVKLQDPAKGNTQIAESINNVAVGDLLGKGHDDVVAATNEEYGAPGGSSDVSFSGALASAAGGSTRVYAIDGASGKYLPGWPIAVPGIIQNVLPLVGPGNDPAIATIGGGPQVITSATGGSLTETAPDGTQTRTLQQNTFGPASDATDRSGQLNLFEGASVGDLLGTGTPDVVKYGLSLSGAANLLAVGQNVPYNHLIGAYDGSTGAPLPAYPTITDDYQFLSASNVAKVTAGSTNQVLAGTGLGLLHAYDGATGKDVSGFPKHTGGWLFSPAALSTDGRTAAITREGYLFEWTTGQTPCQPTGAEWPTFRHDPHDSGNYNVDATPPAAPANASLTRVGSSLKLRFITPGDDGFCGPNVARYRVIVDGSAVDPATVGLGKPGTFAQTTSATIALPAGAHSFSLQAIDGAGNVGAPVSLTVPTRNGQSVTGGGQPVGLPNKAPVVQNPKPTPKPKKPAAALVAPAIFGHTAYLTTKHGVELLGACLAARTCTADIQINLRAKPRTLLARRSRLRIGAGNGGVVTLPLGPRTKALFAALRRRDPGVVVTVTSGKSRRAVKMTLASTSSPGRADASRHLGSTPAVFGHTLFVSTRGTASVLVACLAKRVCTGSLSLQLGRTPAGGLRRVRVGAGHAGIATFRLTGPVRVRLARRHVLGGTMTLRGTGQRRALRFAVELVRYR